jgi:hypothetical protein
VGACARAVGASIAGAIDDEDGGGGGGGGGGAMKPMTATDDGQ